MKAKEFPIIQTISNSNHTTWAAAAGRRPCQQTLAVRFGRKLCKAAHQRA